MIISEPMGYMLFNERMLETYLHAKKWLKPGGWLYGSVPLTHSLTHQTLTHSPTHACFLSHSLIHSPTLSLSLSLSLSGKMYPTQGILYAAPFSDEALFLEQMGKTYFWCVCEMCVSMLPQHYCLKVFHTHTHTHRAYHQVFHITHVYIIQLSLVYECFPFPGSRRRFMESMCLFFILRLWLSTFDSRLLTLLIFGFSCRVQLVTPRILPRPMRNNCTG